MLPSTFNFVCGVALVVASLCVDLLLARAQRYNGNHDDDDTYNYYYNSNNNHQPVGDYLSDWSQHDWGKLSGRSLQSKCVEIPANLTLCHGIGYDQMLLPNILDHDSLNEVTQQAGSWVPLVNINCHPDSKVFLCSLFSPVCLDRLIYPCRSLCEGVQASCVGRMKPYGFDWPDMLKCDKFPMDNDMCIKLIHDVKPDNNCSACKHPLTHEAMIDHFCRADVVMRVSVKEFRDHGSHKELVLQNKRNIYKDGGLGKKDGRHVTTLIEGGATCSCQTINSTNERYLLMGNQRDDKLMINFGIVWNKKDKEFKKGLRAIRKGNTCEGIFRELSANGVETKTPSTSAGKDTGKNNGKNGGKSGGKNGGKNGGRKNPKKPAGKDKPGKKIKKQRKGKDKDKDKDRDKDKDKDKKGGKKMMKKNKERPASPTSKAATRRDVVSKSELEDRALSTFMKAAN